MSVTCKKNSVKYELGILDLARYGDRVSLDTGSLGLGTPIDGRIIITRQAGWTVQALKVRTRINGIEIDLATPLAITPPTAPVGIVTKNIVEADLLGEPILSFGVDTVEAGAKVSVEVELSWPRE